MFLNTPMQFVAIPVKVQTVQHGLQTEGSAQTQPKMQSQIQLVVQYPTQQPINPFQSRTQTHGGTQQIAQPQTCFSFQPQTQPKMQLKVQYPMQPANSHQAHTLIRGETHRIAQLGICSVAQPQAGMINHVTQPQTHIINHVAQPHTRIINYVAQPQTRLINPTVQPETNCSTQPQASLVDQVQKQPTQFQKSSTSPGPRLLPVSALEKLRVKQKKKKVTDLQGKYLVAHVLKMCKEEHLRGAMIMPFTALIERAAMYAGRSIHTVGRIRREAKREKSLGQPRKPLIKTRKRLHFKTVLDDRDMLLLKNLIRDHYIEKHSVPIVRKLVIIYRDEVPTYKNSSSFLNKVLKHIGYIRKRYYSKRFILIEHPTIIAARENYLRTMKKLRKQTENIFYIYECVIDRSLTLHKAWVQKYGYNGALRDKNTCTFMCAVSKNGFLSESNLLCNTYFFKGSYNPGGQLNPEFFEKWLKVHLIPHLPECSVIIMEDAALHNNLIDEDISYYSTKEEMLEYLRKMHVECDTNMRRSELYKLINEILPPQKTFVADSILQQHGHKAMRLPQFMIDLNPAQYAMDKIQKKFFESEIVFNVQNVSNILNNYMESITAEEWTKFFEKVTLLEEECCRKDGEFDDAVDQVLLNLRDCADSGSEKSDLDSDGDDTD